MSNMSLEYSPNSGWVHGVFEPITFVVSSTDQSGGTYFKFRYIADIYVNSTASPYTAQKVARIKLLPNGAGAGVFQVQNIIQDYMKITQADTSTNASGLHDDGIHTLGKNNVSRLWQENSGENYRKIKVNFGQEFSTTEDGAAVEELDELIDNYVSCVISAGMLSSPTYDMGLDYNATGNPTNYLANFTPTSASKRMLSDRPISSTHISTLASTVSVVNQKVTKFEYRTLASMMDSASPVSATGQSIYVGLFSDSDVLLDSQHFVAGTDGGTLPASSDQDFERLQFVGVGPQNLINQTIDTGFATQFNADAVSYYEVFLMKDGTTVPANGDTAFMASCCYRFEVVDADCIYRTLNGTDAYNYVTLAWQNSLGAWDYQAFSLKHQRTTAEIKKTTFDQVEGNWDTAGEAGTPELNFGYRGDEGGLTVSNVEARQTMKARTNIFSEANVDFLENLYLSPRVQLMNYDGTAIPIVVTNKNWIRKNNLNEGGGFIYEVDFQYAKKRPTVR